MKKFGMIALLAILSVGALWGRGYDLEESDEIDIQSIEKIVFTINEPLCITCVKTITIESLIKGNEPGGDLLLSLTGNIHSNRRKAVPRLLVEKRGRELQVSLYPEHLSLIGLISRGTASFSARIPSCFIGEVEVHVSSQNVDLQDLNTTDLLVKNSSGNITIENTITETMTINCSSGRTELDGIRTTGDMKILSSSGNIVIGETVSDGKVEITLSSGDLSGTHIQAGDIIMDNRSGNIDVGTLMCENVVRMDVSSGYIRSKVAEAVSTELIIRSGNCIIDTLSGGLRVKSSSGNVTIGIPQVKDDIDIDCSSGKIQITIPQNSRYRADISSSSGKIRLDDQVIGVVNADEESIIGDVNGGGPLIRLHTSSGNISVTHN